jgi:hypothetical protein
VKRLVFLFAVVMLTPRDTSACTCAGSFLLYDGPSSDEAPTNTHVRLEGSYQGTLVLRAHGGGDVPTRVRLIGGLTELVPTQDLAPNTRYEVAIVNPGSHPPAHVFGTFKTGTARDTTAPQLDSLGHQGTHLNLHAIGSACQVRGPWISLTGFAAHDERPNAELAFGVWSADANGKIDTVNRSPDALLFAYSGTITIGQASACDFHAFAFNGSVVSLAVAAIDEAGNVSRGIRFRADLSRDAP